MGFENVGKVWTPSELHRYLAPLEKPSWATSITFHHTGNPSLADRPTGFTAQGIKNIQSYYQTPIKKVKGVWTSGPHLVLDEDQCWGMCDFRQHGIHAQDIHGSSIGIEVLGNYDVEVPNLGRGMKCWWTAATAGKVLLNWLGLEPNALTVKFHRECRKAKKDRKMCPGTKVEKFWVLELIEGVGDPG